MSTSTEYKIIWILDLKYSILEIKPKYLMPNKAVWNDRKLLEMNYYT